MGLALLPSSSTELGGGRRPPHSPPHLKHLLLDSRERGKGQALLATSLDGACPAPLSPLLVHRKGEVKGHFPSSSSLRVEKGPPLLQCRRDYMGWVLRPLSQQAEERGQVGTGSPPLLSVRERKRGMTLPSLPRRLEESRVEPGSCLLLIPPCCQGRHGLKPLLSRRGWMALPRSLYKRDSGRVWCNLGHAL